MSTTVTVSFTYNPERHVILHDWLSTIEHDRSREIREAIKRGLQQNGSDPIQQILAEVRAIRAESMRTAIDEASEFVEVPGLAPDILANLRSLGE